MSREFTRYLENNKKIAKLVQWFHSTHHRLSMRTFENKDVKHLSGKNSKNSHHLSYLRSIFPQKLLKTSKSAAVESIWRYFFEWDKYGRNGEKMTVFGTIHNQVITWCFSNFAVKKIQKYRGIEQNLFIWLKFYRESFFIEFSPKGIERNNNCNKCIVFCIIPHTTQLGMEDLTIHYLTILVTVELG